MGVSGLGITLLPACWVLLAPALCRPQTGEQGVSSIVLCGESVAIRSRPARTRPEGIASISLPSNRTLWRAMTNEIADVGPVAAGDAVAVIADSFNTIYAFSRKTGRQLWRREKWTSNLGSDGKYFYTLRDAYWDMQALDPDSGRVVWSLKLPGNWLGHYPNLLGIHHGLLFTAQGAVDLEKRKVIHAWARWPRVSSAWVSKTGEIVIGDSEGEIAIYDKAFRRLRKVYVDGGEVVEAVTTRGGILAMAYGQSGGSNRGVLTFLGRQGPRSWRVEWSSGALYPPLPPQPFAIAGENVLVLESEPGTKNLRLTSRKLLNGQVNWTSNEGFLSGPPVVCSNTVYVEDIDVIRGCNVQRGVERTAK
jgi:outer membrane protein assembly factor BamB